MGANLGGYLRLRSGLMGLHLGSVSGGLLSFWFASRLGCATLGLRSVWVAPRATLNSCNLKPLWGDLKPLISGRGYRLLHQGQGGIART
jgi:hypothetical protein